MKTCFPACKQNGAKYASLDEIMTAVGREPHGSWLAGTNRMWHGGIHLTEVTAPGSLLKPDMSDAVIPLQCIAEGEVVACRLNQDYLKSTYLDYSVQFSSTFVLVKSVCKPDPVKENSWLEFYSLYIGLAPLSAFQKCKCMKAKKKVSRRVAGNYESSQGSENPPPAPAPEKEKLAKDSRILVLQETTFMNGSEAQPFGLAQQLDQDGNVTGKTFWVTLKPEFMAEDGEEYAHLPAWMKQVLAKGTFDAVVKPDAGLKINAGDPIGFLGEDIVPVGMGKTSSSAYAHIEVLSADSRMPAFLDNPGAVTSGQKYIRIKPDSLLYTNSGDTFTQTSTKVGIDIHSILPADKCNPKESGGKKYYQISEQSWLSEDEVEECNQYDLIKLGFSALVQETTSDMSMSLKEEWVTEAFETYSEQVIPERGIKQQQLADFYKGMIGKLDSDQNGELSGLELYNAVHHPDLGIRDIAARMMVKHESEWFGGSSDPKWAKFFEAYDPLRKDFTKKWLDSMEWMSQVEPFTSGGAVWHMHPVVFLDAVSSASSGLITLEMVLAANLNENKPQCESVLPYLNKYATAYKMEDKKEIAHFLSQIGHESGFSITEENLNYSAKGMRRIFGCIKGPSQYNNNTDECNLGRLRDKLWSQESSYAHKPEALANYVYAGRMGNDEESSGDGYKYRGRGMIQLTGKDGYKSFTNRHNEMNPGDNQDFVANPDLVISEKEYGVESAFSFWVSKGLDKTAKTSNVQAVTQKVNGGQNGYADRLLRFNAVASLVNIEKE